MATGDFSTTPRAIGLSRLAAGLAGTDIEHAVMDLRTDERIDPADGVGAVLRYAPTLH